MRMMTRTLTSWLAAGLLIAACKSEDKPALETPADHAKEKATEAVDKAADQAETAADRAKRALEMVKEKAAGAAEKAKAAGDLAQDRAAEAVTDVKVAAQMLALVDGRIASATESVQKAPTEELRKAAAVELEQLKVEKQKLEERIAALKAAKTP